MTTIPVSSLNIKKGVLIYDDINFLTGEKRKMILQPIRDGKSLLDNLHDAQDTQKVYLNNLVDFKYKILNRISLSDSDKANYVANKINDIDSEHDNIETLLQIILDRSLKSYDNVKYFSFGQPQDPYFGYLCMDENKNQIDYSKVQKGKFMIYGSSWIYDIKDMDKVKQQFTSDQTDIKDFIITNDKLIQPVVPVVPLVVPLVPLVVPSTLPAENKCELIIFTNKEEYIEVYPKIKGIYSLLTKSPLTESFITPKDLNEGNVIIMTEINNAYANFVQQTVNQHLACISSGNASMNVIGSQVILPVLSSQWPSDRIYMIGSMVKYIEHRYLYSYHPIGKEQDKVDKMSTAMKTSESGGKVVNRIKLLYDAFKENPINLLIHCVSVRIRGTIGKACDSKFALCSRTVTQSSTPFNNEENFSYFKMRPFDLTVYRYAFEAIEQRPMEKSDIFDNNIVELICMNCIPKTPTDAPVVSLYNIFATPFKAELDVRIKSIIITTQDGTNHTIDKIDNWIELREFVLNIFRQGHAITHVKYPSSISLQNINDIQTYSIVVVEILHNIFHIPIVQLGQS